MIDRAYVRGMLLPALSLLAATAGCTESPPGLTMNVVAVEAPTDADSGEPFLSSAGDTVLMSWLGRSADGRRTLFFSRYSSGAWDGAHAISAPERVLVNVADFPSVVRAPDGALWSHWLERDSVGFGYGIRIARSGDGGETWSDPWTPHQDGTAAEHGFVSIMPLKGEVGFVWLDGRAYVAPADGAPPSMETALYFRDADAAGPVGPEVSIDPRVCDCCQTDVAVTGQGPVLVYRDRSPEEIRDIRIVRRVGGTWIDGGLVHEDGWETGACPINGPAVAARGDRVAVAWFTAAQGDARVQVAFSDDGGRGFATPTVVDEGAPAGRVDVVMLDDGTAVVSWLERTGAAGAEVRLRRVGPDGHRLEGLAATAGLAERATGFPRLALAGRRAIILAWTDGTDLLPRVRVTRIELEDS